MLHRPPHAATVAQRKEPHAATVVQRREPHAATVVQRKEPHLAMAGRVAQRMRQGDAFVAAELLPGDTSTETPSTTYPLKSSNYGEDTSQRITLHLLQQEDFLFLNRSGKYTPFKPRSDEYLFDTLHEPCFHGGKVLKHPDYHCAVGRLEVAKVRLKNPYFPPKGVTYPDFYGTYGGERILAYELKTPHGFRNTLGLAFGSDWVKEMQARRTILPKGVENVFIFDLWSGGQSLEAAASDLQNLICQSSEAYEFWSKNVDGIRFIYDKSKSLTMTPICSLLDLDGMAGKPDVQYATNGVFRCRLPLVVKATVNNPYLEIETSRKTSICECARGHRTYVDTTGTYTPGNCQEWL